MPEINPNQITFARVRRHFTKARLAKELGITSRSVQNYETGASVPDDATLDRIAALLDFPPSFFFIEEDMPTIGEHSASFRSNSRMSDRKRGCALNAGAIAFRIDEWMEARFKLPQANLPDLSDLSPEDAALTLRIMWGLGYAPIRNMIHLLESKGVRVFSLAEESRDVDAFCAWYEGRPFIFLNTLKSAERSRFDAAHELGHLVRDVFSMRHGDPQNSDMESQANAFAAAFLMPKESVIASRPPAFTIKYLTKLKRHWGVSLVALARRYNTLNQISEWTYRGLMLEISKNGYRTREPDSMERETSQLLTQVLNFLKTKGMGRSDIARSLSISVDEVNALTFGLTRLSVVVGRAEAEVPRSPAQGPAVAKLRLLPPRPIPEGHSPYPPAPHRHVGGRRPR